MRGSSGSSSTKITTYTGSVAETRWGPVQVKISVHAAERAYVLLYPSGNSGDAKINNYALLILINESLKAQSANIDMVSGAIVTSGGYVQSLQAALDEAVSGQGARWGSVQVQITVQGSNCALQAPSIDTMSRTTMTSGEIDGP